LLQIWTGPDSGVFGHKRKGQRDHFRFVQEFFSCLIDDAGTVRPVLEKPLIAFYPDVESTAEETGRLGVLFFKAGGFVNY
jgi:hypothetical protein